MEELRGKPHVVIVGGGFAGIKACKAFKVLMCASR